MIKTNVVLMLTKKYKNSKIMGLILLWILVIGLLVIGIMGVLDD